MSRIGPRFRTKDVKDPTLGSGRGSYLSGNDFDENIHNTTSLSLWNYRDLVKAISGQEYLIYENQLLGAGASGRVYIGKDVKNDTKVAVKVVLSDPYKVTTEVVALTKLGLIPGIIGLLDYGFLSNGNKLFMILQYFEGGIDLYRYKKMGGVINLPTAMAAFWQLILASEAMLSANVEHSDLQPWNILYYEETRYIRVCDLSYAILHPDLSVVDDAKVFKYSSEDISVLAANLFSENPNYPTSGNLTRAVCIYLNQLGECLEYLFRMIEPGVDFTDDNGFLVLPIAVRNLLGKMRCPGNHGLKRWEELYQVEFVKDCKKAYMKQCEEIAKEKLKN